MAGKLQHIRQNGVPKLGSPGDPRKWGELGLLSCFVWRTWGRVSFLTKCASCVGVRGWRSRTNTTNRCARYNGNFILHQHVIIWPRLCWGLFLGDHETFYAFSLARVGRGKVGMLFDVLAYPRGEACCVQSCLIIYASVSERVKLRPRVRCHN